MIYGIRDTAVKNAARAARTVICIFWTGKEEKAVLKSTALKQAFAILFPKTETDSIKSNAANGCEYA